MADKTHEEMNPMSDNPKTIYRTSMEGMYAHLHGDTCEQILPEGIPDMAASAMYHEFARDAATRTRLQRSPDNRGARFAEDRPVGYRTVPARMSISHVREQKRTLWDVIITSLRSFFGGRDDA